MNQEISEFERNMILLSAQANVQARDTFLFNQLKDFLQTIPVMAPLPEFLLRRIQNEILYS